MNIYKYKKRKLHNISISSSILFRFCKEHLIPLLPFNNNFLKADKSMLNGNSSGKPKYFVSDRQGLLIEIYYTESISLYEAKQFVLIGTIGKGTSRPQG